MHTLTMCILQFCVFLSSIFNLALSQGIFPGKDDNCFDPAVQGNCKAFHPRFYFNINSGFCDCFVYSGCGGNANKFKTLKECMHKCGVRRDQQIITTKCRNTFSGTQELREILREFSFSKKRQTSQFDGRKEAESSKIPTNVASSCFDSPRPGHCKGLFPRFYYNVNAGYCDCFIYTGCGGNDNSFETHGQCMQTCGVRSSKQIVSEACKRHFKGTRQLEAMLSDLGNSNQHTETPHFDVNIEDESRPETSNSGKVNCLASVQVGACRAYIPRFYYNANLGYCDCFVYSGCGGNSNSFDSHRECMNACSVRREEQIVSESCQAIFRGRRELEEMLNDFGVDNTKPETPQVNTDKDKVNRPETSNPGRGKNCYASLQSGNCKAYIPRFYFNVNAGYCDCFVFEGCGGNSNNFETLEECTNFCGVHRDRQIISKKCRDILKGTRQLENLLKQYDNTSKNKRRPPSISDIKEGILIAAASLPPPPPAPVPTKSSSSSVPSFFTPAKHPWQ